MFTYLSTQLIKPEQRLYDHCKNKDFAMEERLKKGTTSWLKAT